VILVWMIGGGIIGLLTTLLAGLFWMPKRSGEPESDLTAAETLPEVERVARVGLRPGDTIVVECSVAVTAETCERIRDHFKAVWPDHQIVVIGPELRLKVLSAEAPSSSA
jgi:hypothetical protein